MLASQQVSDSGLALGTPWVSGSVRVPGQVVVGSSKRGSTISLGVVSVEGPTLFNK